MLLVLWNNASFHTSQSSHNFCQWHLEVGQVFMWKNVYGLALPVSPCIHLHFLFRIPCDFWKL